MSSTQIAFMKHLQASDVTLVQLVQASRRAFAHTPNFSLSAEEVAALERYGNSGALVMWWSRVGSLALVHCFDTHMGWNVMV